MYKFRSKCHSICSYSAQLTISQHCFRQGPGAGWANELISFKVASKGIHIPNTLHVDPFMGMIKSFAVSLDSVYFSHECAYACMFIHTCVSKCLTKVMLKLYILNILETRAFPSDGFVLPIYIIPVSWINWKCKYILLFPQVNSVQHGFMSKWTMDGGH